MIKHPDFPSGETACPARPARRDKTGSPYRLDLHTLPGNPDSRLEFDWRFPLSPEWINSVVTLEGTEIPCHVELTTVSEGILAHITGRVGTVAQCSRCLDPVHEVLSLDETRMLFFPESSDSAREQAGEDSVDILEVSDDSQIDLEPLLRNNLVLALPNSPLCDENCKGLRPDCGERLDMLPADHHHENIDPRQVALGDLAKSLRENPEGENQWEQL